MRTIAGQLTIGEKKILEYLGARKGKYIMGPQKIIADAIGYSRAHTNVILKKLAKKQLIFMYPSMGMDRKLRLITLEAING